jgi:hypothetical protein
VGVASFVVLNALSIDNGTTLGVVGLVLGVAVPVIFDRRTTAPRTHEIVLIDNRLHSFGKAIREGLRDALGGEAGLRLSTQAPGHGDRPQDWQLRILAGAEVRRASAVVILTAETNIAANGSDPETESRLPEVWKALASLAASGVFVVCIDVRPDPEPFEQAGVLAPRFVSSDYATGGDILARWFIDQLARDEHSLAILFLGPALSPAMTRRTQGLLYGLVIGGFIERTRAYDLGSWADAADVIRSGLAALADSIANDDRRALVFPGDDEMAAIADAWLGENAPALRPRVSIAGYDAVRSTNGELEVAGLRSVSFTVDARPYEQGDRAGQVLLGERAGRTARLPADYLVQPSGVPVVRQTP